MVLQSPVTISPPSQADVVVLAVKPQIMRNVVLDLAAALPKDAVVVSVAAGISIKSLQSWLGVDKAIVRAMPNTPSLVRTGATGLFANEHTDEWQRAVVAEILKPWAFVVGSNLKP